MTYPHSKNTLFKSLLVYFVPFHDLWHHHPNCRPIVCCSAFLSPKTTQLFTQGKDAPEIANSYHIGLFSIREEDEEVPDFIITDETAQIEEPKQQQQQLPSDEKPEKKNSKQFRIGGRRQSTPPTPSKLQTEKSLEITKTVIGVLSTASLLSISLDALLMQSETLQAWRYLWPLIGLFYVSYGVSNLFPSKVMAGGGSSSRDLSTTTRKQNPFDIVLMSFNSLSPMSDDLSQFLPTTSNRPIGAISFLAGIGLLIGGFMDAFFPVWYTSPDLLGTRAGIESDSAAILLLLTILSTPKLLMKQQQIDSVSSLSTEKNVVQLPSGEKQNAIFDIDMIQQEDSQLLRIKQWAFTFVLLSVLYAQLWELGASTFYSWGEMLGLTV
uniref:Uncharacterized protein n=1 Tax=Ditylum brightwellii TaxID=49249 RepID=A0A7S1VXX8_9STRA|mmetsp:Transcript_1171/g.1917  ORF Transcript_1171/g.1917 Transcript_1171/m.1917 type:complete len:381 (+) Transcript_1171:121-1263(+)